MEMKYIWIIIAIIIIIAIAGYMWFTTKEETK